MLTTGVLGTYTHFEATEVIATKVGRPQPINLFTLLVAEDRGAEVLQPFRFLNAKRLSLDSVTDWTFGVARYTRHIDELELALASMMKTGFWSASGYKLYVGKVQTVPPQFVPPDSHVRVPWNKVLKSNLWNGSHLFEWSAPRKLAFDFLFADPRRLQQFSALVMESVPFALAGLSDRIGSIAVQLPVTAIMCQFNKRQTAELEVEVAWHPRVTPRALRVSCEQAFDRTIRYASAAVQAPSTVLPLQSHLGSHRTILWDESHGVVLAASGEAAFINTIAMSMGMLLSEPRVFAVPQVDGVPITHSIGLQGTSQLSVGTRERDETGGSTHKRMYQEQLEALAAERLFVQYKPRPGARESEHQKAIADLRFLIGRYGRQGAWLWDPFLSANDVVQTLFHCPHMGADLRALTAGAEIVQYDGAETADADGLSGKRDFIERQQRVLNAIQSNWLGFRLEYRIRFETSAFGFHDRFLIFPTEEEGALVWSLGTSVNGVGKNHHILQRVDNGQLVMDAFVELWEELDQQSQLIWQKTG